MKRGAFVSGLSNPFGSDSSNAQSYVAALVIRALAGLPFATQGVGAAAAAAAPFVTSRVLCL